MFTLNNFFKSFFSILIFISLFCCIYQTHYTSTNTISSNNNISYFSDNKFCWPIPGNHYITSYFGPRKSPTSGASSNHSGIDIGAPEKTNIYAVLSGTVVFTGFKGAGGYSITINSGNFTISYCHVSPKYLVKVNDFVEKNTLISNVGPKNVYDVPNNPYKDSSGRPTNGASTGCHLHLTIKKDGIAVNPLDYF